MAIVTSKANEIVDLFLAEGTDVKMGLLTDENTEVSGGGYARQPVEFAVANNGQATNVDAVEFPIATAPWGTVRYAVIYNGDDMVYRNTLTTPQAVGTGNTFIIPANYFIVRVKGAI